jgi:hypothetical protein
MESKLNDHILTKKKVTNKPHLNKLLWSNYRNLTHLKRSLDFLEKLLKDAFYDSPIGPTHFPCNIYQCKK